MAKLKLSSGYCDSTIVQPGCQPCKTKIRHRYSGHQSEIKGILIALANATIDKLCYIFTDSWTITDGLADWSATLDTMDWKIKDSLFEATNC